MTEATFLTLAASRRAILTRIAYPPDGNLGALTIEGPTLLLWHEPKRPDIESSREGWRVLTGPPWESRLVQLDYVTVLDDNGPYHDPITLEVPTSPGTGSVFTEALSLAIRTGTRLKMNYRKVGASTPEWRDVTPTGIKAGTLYTEDHDRGGAIRGFKLDGILSVEAKGERVPRWDGAAYVLPTEEPVF